MTFNTYRLPTISFGPETDDDTLDTVMRRWGAEFTLRDGAKPLSNGERSIDALWNGTRWVDEVVCAELIPYDEEYGEFRGDPIQVPIDDIENIEIF